ncbi:hypothetical protein DFH08DRAFT_938227 [Mycena albidolilacea]|uniref:Uncharacterized protein n=1 Tax=Mycena albidolilacea TaxID=1033008 RepID=A0AAD6ZWB0_9AGAR|nr:hypothetical protein DFH08DRAFT_938227 [Mycena albidolilacea]
MKCTLCSVIASLSVIFTESSAQAVTLYGLSPSGADISIVVNQGQTIISAAGVNSQGGTTYVEVVEETSLIQGVGPSSITTLFSVPTTFTETFVEDASHVFGTTVLVQPGVGTITASETCAFGVDGLGTCGFSGHGIHFSVVDNILPFTTLAALEVTPSSSPSRMQSPSIGGGSTSVPSQTFFTSQHRHIAPGTIVGIAVGIAVSLLGLAAIALILRRRQRERRIAEGHQTTTGLVSPFTLIASAEVPGQDMEEINPGETRRQRLEAQLVATKRTVANLESRTSSTTLDLMVQGETGRESVTAQLQAAREQIEMLVQRINALEETVDSSRDTRQPPPEYS